MTEEKQLTGWTWQFKNCMVARVNQEINKFGQCNYHYYVVVDNKAIATAYYNQLDLYAGPIIDIDEALHKIEDPDKVFDWETFKVCGNRIFAKVEGGDK